MTSKNSNEIVTKIGSEEIRNLRQNIKEDGYGFYDAECNGIEMGGFSTHQDALKYLVEAIWYSDILEIEDENGGFFEYAFNGTTYSEYSLAVAAKDAYCRKNRIEPPLELRYSIEDEWNTVKNAKVRIIEIKERRPFIAFVGDNEKDFNEYLGLVPEGMKEGRDYSLVTGDSFPVHILEICKKDAKNTFEYHFGLVEKLTERCKRRVSEDSTVDTIVIYSVLRRFYTLDKGYVWKDSMGLIPHQHLDPEV